ncbi:MAG: efflux RND transporter periplasmic adaptor subunit [Burkholderiales bacterium]|nr:efflux RND transporter periplasmic adaptor subunit [Burkholderiales bacterium]
MTKTLRNWLIRLVVLLLIAAGAFAGWRYWQAANVKTLDERYQFEDIAKGDVTQTITANGTLNPVVLVNVGTQVSGTVRKLYADFNSTVKAGQILLELDPTLFQAAVEQSRGNVANASAALKLAQANEARIRELFGQEYVSKQDLDAAVQQREAAEAQLRTAKGQVARDEANVGYSVIRSPVSGIVVSRQVDIGQTVAASFQTPTLFQIAQDLSVMQINTNVAEADVGKIKVEQPVRFTVDAFPGRRFEGKVSQIRLSPIIQQNVVTYNVVVSVDNRDLKLMPGMTAYIYIDVDKREDALLVPSSALRFRPRDMPPEPKKAATAPAPGEKKQRGGGARVYVARGDKLVPVTIQTGLSDGKMVEVTSGELKAGDRVATQNRVPDSAGGAPAAGQQPRVRAF